MENGFHFVRLISQLRLAGVIFAKFTVNRFIYSWDQRKICEACNHNATETIEHLLLTCRAYKPNQEAHLERYIEHNPQVNLIGLLTELTKEKMIKIYNLLSCALKIRAFLVSWV